MTRVEALEREVEKLDEEEYKRFREWLADFESSQNRAPASAKRSFLDLKGSIKVGPGDVSEDIRKAREMRGRV